MAGMKLVKKGALLDRRAETIAGVRTPPAEVLPPAPPAPQTVDDYVSAITVEWEDAQRRFLRVGALLDAAERSLAAPDFQELVRRVNISPSVRSQILLAYRALQSGRVPQEMSAAGYATVYLLADLSDSEREAAAREGLMVPTVPKAAVQKFKRTVRGRQTDERAQLLAERERVMKRLSEIDRRLSEI